MVRPPWETFLALVEAKSEKGKFPLTMNFVIDLKRAVVRSPEVREMNLVKLKYS